MRKHVILNKITVFANHLLQSKLTAKEIYQKTVDFLISIKKFISNEIWEYWQIDELIQFDSNLFCCECDKNFLYKQIESLSNKKSIDNCIMTFRDILWNTINLEADMMCSCHGGLYKILFDIDELLPFYHCDICGNCYSLKMIKHNPKNYLRPIKLEEFILFKNLK